MASAYMEHLQKTTTGSREVSAVTQEQELCLIDGSWKQWTDLEKQQFMNSLLFGGKLWSTFPDTYTSPLIFVTRAFFQAINDMGWDAIKSGYEEMKLDLQKTALKHPEEYA